MTEQKAPSYMLWQELDSKKEAAQVLREALAYATRKYGQPPAHVRVPLAFPDLNGDTPEGLTVERHKDVQPTYLWVQVSEAIQPLPSMEQVQE